MTIEKDMRKLKCEHSHEKNWRIQLCCGFSASRGNLTISLVAVMSDPADFASIILSNTLGYSSCNTARKARSMDFLSGYPGHHL